MLRAPVTVTAATFDALWAAQQLDTHHPTLTVASALRGDQDQRAYLAAAHADLDRVGLLVSGRPHPDLVDTLRLIAAPGHEFYGWITTSAHHQLGVLVAADSLATGASAIAAVRDGDTITMRPVRADTAAHTLTSYLPAAPAGRGHTITLPETDMTSNNHAAGSGHAREEDESAGYMRPVRPTVTTADTLTRLLREPRTGAGQLYTAARSRHGRRHRNPTPLAYIDTRAYGRWLTTTEPNADGQPWIIATPTTADQLAQRLHTTHTKLTAS